MVGAVVVFAVLVLGTAALTLTKSKPEASTVRSGGNPQTAHSTDNPQTAASTDSPQTTQVSFGAEATQFLATEEGLSAKGEPYAQAVVNHDSDATQAVQSAQAQTTQIEQAAMAGNVQSLQPGSGTNQCLAQALAQPASQVSAAVDQCEAGTTGSPAFVQQTTQIEQAALTEVTNDLQSADAAMGSLAGLMQQESSVASGLSVPSSLAGQKQDLLGALDVATTDAATSATAGSISDSQSSAQQVWAAIVSVSNQETSLAAAMKAA